MLRIYYGDLNTENSVYNGDGRFNNVYESEWLEQDLVKKVIKDIDKSDVISGELIQSPVLGPIPPTQLSGGTKTLILMINEPDLIFNASACGDNCAKWILEIAKERDLTINLRHLMHFDNIDIPVEVINNNKIVYNYRDLVYEAIKYI